MRLTPMPTKQRVEVRTKIAKKKVAVGHRINPTIKKETQRNDHISDLVWKQERKCKTYAEVVLGKTYLGSDI